MATRLVTLFVAVLVAFTSLSIVTESSADAASSWVRKSRQQKIGPCWVKVTLTQRPRGGIEVQAVSELNR